MAFTVYIHSNDLSSFEIPEDIEKASTVNNSQLSLEEFEALADELGKKFMEYVGPDFPPLSDYAMSRESIYEDHP